MKVTTSITPCTREVSAGNYTARPHQWKRLVIATFVLWLLSYGFVLEIGVPGKDGWAMGAGQGVVFIERNPHDDDLPTFEFSMPQSLNLLGWHEKIAGLSDGKPFTEIFGIPMWPIPFFVRALSAWQRRLHHERMRWESTP